MDLILSGVFFVNRGLIKSVLFVGYVELCLVKVFIKIHYGADTLVSKYWWQSKLTNVAIKGRTQIWLFGGELAVEKKSLSKLTETGVFALKQKRLNVSGLHLKPLQ